MNKIFHSEPLSCVLVFDFSFLYNFRKVFCVCVSLSPSLVLAYLLLGSNANQVLCFRVTTLTHLFKRKIFVSLQTIAYSVVGKPVCLETEHNTSGKNKIKMKVKCIA